MKLLFFIHSLRSGGAERVTANLANYWSAAGWQVTILTMAPQRFDFYELHPAVRRISLDLASEGGNILIGFWNNIPRIWMLRKVLKQVGPDMAVAMTTRANVLLAFAAGALTSMCAIGSEHSYPPRLAPNSIWGLLRRWTYAKLTAVVAPANDTRGWLQSNTRAHRVVVIPNGIEWPLPIQEPIVPPQTVVADGKHVLLAVGRLEAVKGFDRLIDIFTRLAAKHEKWVLVILGEGSERKALEAQISKRGMNAKILLPGRVGNVAHWYSRADLYVCSSRFEGFGNTLVEALAHGLPTVSFDCETGPRDIIRDGVDGLLVPPGDLPALTSALDQLMSDDAMRQRFAARAPEARERFSLERIAGIWEALFTEVRSERC